MTSAGLIRQAAAEAGFSVEDGMQQLVRTVVLRVPVALAENVISKRKLRANGRRVPMGQHARSRLFSEIIDKIGAERLREYVSDKHIEVYPHIERMHYVEPQQPDGSYESFYAFGVRPEIKLPDLSGHDIKVPDPDTGGDFYERLIADLPRKMAEWEKVERPCQIGDRLTLAPLPAGKGEAFKYVLDDDDENRDFREQFLGAGPGDVCTISKPEGMQLKIMTVEKPLISEFNLDFIRKIDPSCKSREEFDASFRKAHVRHMQSMTSKIMMRRSEQLLDDAAEDFPLPPGEVAAGLLNWRIALGRQLREFDFVRDVGEQGLADAERQIEATVRRRLIVQAFVRENSLMATKEEIEASLDVLAGQYEDPQLFRKHFKAKAENLERLNAEVLMQKFCDRVMDQARNVAEPMTFKQFERLLAIDEGKAAA